jgi:hypothetical protein
VEPLTTHVPFGSQQSSKAHISPAQHACPCPPQAPQPAAALHVPDVGSHGPDWHTPSQHGSPAPPQLVQVEPLHASCISFRQEPAQHG